MSSLGSAQLAMNQMSEAISNLRSLFDYYVESGDTDRAIAITEHSHADFIVPMVDVVARAVDLASPDSLQAGRVLCNYGYALSYMRDGYEPAHQAYEQALTIARRLGDTSLELRTLSNSGNTDCLHLRWQEGLNKCLRAIELTELVDDPYAKLRAHLWASYSLYVNGEPERASAYSGVLVKIAEELRDRLWLARSLSPSTALATSKGDWEAARNLGDQGLAASHVEPQMLCSRVIIEYETGNPDRGEVFLEQLMQLSGGAGMRNEATKACIIPAVSRITGRPEHFELAEARANALLSSPYSSPRSATLGSVGLALMAVERSDAETAKEQYATLEARKGEFSVFALFSHDRILGLLAHTIGTLEDAQGHFEDALAFCRKASYRPELAWALCDYADMLLERKGEGDSEKAVAMLDESLAISTELGMRPLMERVLSRREILKA